MQQQSRFCFGRRSRLSDADAYRFVFNQPQRSVDRNFSVLWRLNTLGRSRLGLAIAKKNVQRAVDRNRVKRVVRESFRHHQQAVSGVDIVVLSRRGIELRECMKLRKSIDRHWLRVIEALSK